MLGRLLKLAKEDRHQIVEIVASNQQLYIGVEAFIDHKEEIKSPST